MSQLTPAWIAIITGGVVLGLLANVAPHPSAPASDPSASAATKADAATEPSEGADQGKQRPTSPTREAPPADIKGMAALKIRQIPRKKLPRVELDLDGDGVAEILQVKQTQPAIDWRGKDKAKGPHFELTIRSKNTPSEAPPRWRNRRYGWAQGWAQIGVQVGGGKRLGLVFWALPEDNDTHVTYVSMPNAASAKFGDFARTPLSVVDTSGDGVEEVVVVSQELYQDFFKTGTMQLLRWSPGEKMALSPVFERPVFEYCFTKDATGKPLVVAVRADQRQLRLLEPLRWRRPAFRTLDSRPVVPAKRGPAYSIPTGFALSCAAGPSRVQYASERFGVDSRKFVMATP